MVVRGGCAGRSAGNVSTLAVASGGVKQAAAGPPRPAAAARLYPAAARPGKPNRSCRPCGRAAGGGGDKPFWSDGGGSSPAGNTGDNPDPASDGVLAGQVIDPYDRHPADAIIQVAMVDPSGQGAPPRPVGVAADAKGYFVIQGLK